MSLALAIKNRDAIVIAADVPHDDNPAERFGQVIGLPNRCAILITGNREFIRQPIIELVVPKATPGVSAAAVAQILGAALTLQVVPRLDELKGRVEIIVAGIDPIRHTEQPSLYYLDSAQNFQLQLAPGDAVATGSTAAITSLLSGHKFADANIQHLQVLAKECLAATKLRWPTAIGDHSVIGVITTQNIQFQQY